jgi:nickel transport protein
MWARGIVPLLSFKSLTFTLLALMLAGQAAAHAAFVDLRDVAAISVLAQYDTGEPMADAQVAIYAPDDPATPWLTGQTDARGWFLFMPDPAISGRWAVQVRQAGHGAMAYADVAAGDSTVTIIGTAPAAGLTWAQKALMLASVLWGAIGTALYFRRKPSGAAA